MPPTMPAKDLDPFPPNPMPTLPVPLKHRLRKLLALFPPNWCLAILVALDGYAFMHPVLREVRAREYGF